MRFKELTSHTVTEGQLDTPGAEDSPVAQAIIRRILLQRTDLLGKYGPERVGAAVDEVADFVGDVEEIGSSDVSGWIRHVEQMLGNMQQGVAEATYNPDTFVGKKGTYKGYGITQEGPHQWGISSSVRKFSTLNAAKRHIDKVLVVSEQGVAEGGYPDPEQEQMDANRRAALQREREPAGSEKIDAAIAAQHAQRQQYEQTGKFWLKYKDSQKHVSAEPFNGKAAATAAAQQMIRSRPEVRGNLLITAYGPNGE